MMISFFILNSREKVVKILKGIGAEAHIALNACW